MLQTKPMSHKCRNGVPQSHARRDACSYVAASKPRSERISQLTFVRSLFQNRGSVITLALLRTLFYSASELWVLDDLHYEISNRRPNENLQ